jgi:hypothetical protein
MGIGKERREKQKEIVNERDSLIGIARINVRGAMSLGLCEAV